MADLLHPKPTQDKCNTRTIVPGELHITIHYTRQINNEILYLYKPS